MALRAVADGYGATLNGLFGLPNKTPNNRIGDGVEQERPAASSAASRTSRPRIRGTRTTITKRCDVRRCSLRSGPRAPAAVGPAALAPGLADSGRWSGCRGVWRLTTGQASPRLGRMRRSTVSLALLAVVLGACAPGATGDLSIRPDAALSAAPSPSAALSSPVAAATFCPGVLWPPYEFVGIPGITVSSVDRATVEVANGTAGSTTTASRGGSPSGSRRAARSRSPRSNGELAAGNTVRVTLGQLGDLMDVPITIAFWDEPCGEDCQRAAVAATLITRSAVEPASS